MLFSKLKVIVSLKIDLLVKSEPMEVDLIDSEKATPVETLKKPVKQVPIKKEVSDEMTLSNMLSATSMVWMQYETVQYTCLFKNNVCFAGIYKTAKFYAWECKDLTCSHVKLMIWYHH